MISRKTGKMTFINRVISSNKVGLGNVKIFFLCVLDNSKNSYCLLFFICTASYKLEWRVPLFLQPYCWHIFQVSAYDGINFSCYIWYKGKLSDDQVEGIREIIRLKRVFNPLSFGYLKYNLDCSVFSNVAPDIPVRILERRRPRALFENFLKQATFRIHLSLHFKARRSTKSVMKISFHSFWN